jgi:hypothetical protein
VSRIRISVFVICSGMAAVSGIVAASLLQSVQSNAGAGNTLVLAVGAAVIGGTSLFGGRGRIIDAVLGGLVVAVIINGMSDLIQGANSAGYEWVVTGAAAARRRFRRGRPPRAARLSGPAAHQTRGAGAQSASVAGSSWSGRTAVIWVPSPARLQTSTTVRDSSLSAAIQAVTAADVGHLVLAYAYG